MWGNQLPVSDTSGLNYKHVTIINYASSGINKLKASLNDDVIVVIYDHHMFIVQATAGSMALSYVMQLLFIEKNKHRFRILRIFFLCLTKIKNIKIYLPKSATDFY